MSFNSNNPLSYLGLPETDVPQIIVSKRNPGVNDINHKLGDLWINYISQSFWGLCGLGGGIANWQNFGASGSLSTITPDVGGAVSPIAGNINLFGSPDLLFTAGVGTITSTNLLKITQFVVGHSQAPYTSIQAAVNAAALAGGGVVAIRAGTYIENVTMAANVSITGFSGISESPITVIRGTVTASYTGDATLCNICIEENAATPLVVSGAAVMTLAVQNCTIISTNSDAISINNTNAQVQFIYSLCTQLGTFAHINVVNGQFVTLYSIYGDPNSSATASLVSGGLIFIIGGLLNLGVRGTGGFCLIYDVLMQPKNVIPVDCQGTSAMFCFNSVLVAPAGLSAMNVTGFAASANYCTMDSTALFVISGNSNFNFDIISFDANDGIDPALLTVARTVRPFSTSAPTNVTAVRGLCSFSSNDFNVDSQGFVSMGPVGTPSLTVGVATATLMTIPIPVNSAIEVSASVAGYEAAGSSGAGGTIFGLAKKAGAGTGALVGTPTVTTYLSAPLVAATIAMVIDGGGDNVLIQSTGVALLTISWKASATTVVVP